MRAVERTRHVDVSATSGLIAGLSVCWACNVSLVSSSRRHHLSATAQRRTTPPVIRYVSAHASTWPEYVPTRRTLDRSTVRCTSLSCPLNATAVSLDEQRPDQWTRPAACKSSNSPRPRRLAGGPRHLAGGTTVRSRLGHVHLHVHCCLSHVTLELCGNGFQLSHSFPFLQVSIPFPSPFPCQPNSCSHSHYYPI